MSTRIRTGAYFALAAAFFTIGVSNTQRSVVWYLLAMVFLVLGVWRQRLQK